MFDRKPLPISRFTTMYLRRLILLVMLLFVGQAQHGLARTIAVEIAAEGYEGDGYWIGLFNHPITAESSPKLWQQSESVETALQISDQEDVVLVVLQKGSVPLYQRIEPGSDEILVELQFQTGRTLKGEVLSTDGFQIVDAIISVHHLNGLRPQQYPDEFTADWQSDQHGIFSISGLETGTHEIRITPRIGLPEELQELIIEEEEPEIKEKNLQLQNVYFISGEVVNEENESIDWADVIATEWNDGLSSIQTSTNKKGSFRIGPFVKDMSIWVEARVSDTAFSEVQKVVSGRADLKLTLRKLLNLTGTVVERETGSLVEQFTISALSGLGKDRLVWWTKEYTFDGSKGHFSVNVDWRITHVVVCAPGFDFRFIPVSLTKDNVHDLGIIELDRGRVVKGVVVDVDTGSPIKGAEVQYTEWDHQDEIRAFYTVRHHEPKTTDALGEFTLSDLPKEEGTLQIWGMGYFRTETRLSEDDEFLRIELREMSHPTISGRVESTEGFPMKVGLWLYDVDAKTTHASSTKSDGTFEIVTNDGEYELSAGNSEHGKSKTETIVVENQIPVVDVLLTIDTSGNSISGKVTGLMEKESLILRVYNSNEGTIRSNSYLYGNASYSFSGISEGLYHVEGRTSSNRKISNEVRFEGNNTTAIVDFAFDGTSNLSGTVTAGGKPVDNVRVWAEPKTEGHIGGECKSQEDGSYLIEHLEDGEYDIRTNRGFSFEVVITSDTYFDLEVGQLTFAGNVVTKLPTQDMVVVLKSDSDESIYATSKVGSEGNFRIDGLTAGSYSVRVTKSGRITPDYAKTTYSLRLDHSIEDYQIKLGTD